MQPVMQVKYSNKSRFQFSIGTFFEPFFSWQWPDLFHYSLTIYACSMARICMWTYFHYSCFKISSLLGLLSPTEGYLTLEMETLPSTSQCIYPAWLSSAQRFISLDFKTLFEFSPDGKEMKFSNYSYTTKQEDLISVASCIETIEEGENYVKLLTRKYNHFF